VLGNQVETAVIIGIVQARMSSTRLPGKVLSSIMGRPMMALQIERLRRSRRIDRLVVATSDQPSDDPIVAFCSGENIACYRGPLDDVLTRVYDAAVTFGPAENVVRLTADCPLTDWEIVDTCIDLHLAAGNDYTSNAVLRSYPDGLDVEVMTAAALRDAYLHSPPGPEREHVTMFLYRHPERFKIGHMVQEPDLADVRWTVDTAEDLKLVTGIFETLLPSNQTFRQQDILALFDLPPPGPPQMVVESLTLKTTSRSISRTWNV